MPSHRLALGLAAAVLVAATTGEPARAVTPPGIAVNEVMPVPADGVFHLEGHGFGGGVGLSQWGAQGGAEQGATAATILAHYYPTATLTAAPAATIRVLLSGLTPGATAFQNAPGLTITGADGTAVTPPTDPAHARLRLASAGSSLQLQNSADGTSWTNEAAVVSPANLTDSSAVLVLTEGDGSSRTYRGHLALTSANGSVRTIDVLALEDYVRGVVPRESPPSWLPAALQSQAVAARTYAAYLASRVSATSSYDICDTTACQVYGGQSAETSSTDSAVAATVGQELKSGSAPIAAQYGASNGGWSVDGGQPYLTAAVDPWDGVDPGNYNHSWTSTITAAQLQADFPTVGTLTAIDVTRRDGNGDWGGRILAMTLTGHDAAGNPTIVQTNGGTLGLRSSWWRVMGQTSTIAAAIAPTTIGLQAVTPFRIVETSKQGVTANRAPVAGLHGVPIGASAVFVVASAGRLSKAQRADLLVWPSGGNRSGAVAIDRLSGSAPTSGSALVPLGPDGALDVAVTTSTVGLELTVVGWAGTAATSGISTVVSTALNTTVAKGTRRLTLPVRGSAAIVSVTASATGRTGNLTVNGVPTQTLGSTPQTTTLIVPTAAAITVSQAAHVRVQVLGWLTPTGVRLTSLRAVSRPPVIAGARGSFLQVTGGAVPATAKTVIALMTETSAAAGDLSAYPHGSSAAQLTAAPRGRAATTLITTTLKDGLLIVKPPAGGARVQLTVLGWAG